MKVLAIGNSFSEDATAYLNKIAAAAGVNIKVVNLYIGGCSLETHAKNIQENNKAYRYELNGEYTDKTVSITETLKEAEWDVVTIQQASPYSGIYESYFPYALTLLEEIKSCVPKTKIYFHQTWAYENDFPHPWFSNYNKSQDIMHSAIVNASTRFSNEYKLKLIPSGEVIKEIRKSSLFNRNKGGESICRDTYHMSLLYGRYALGATWFQTLTGISIYESSFLPTAFDILNGFSIEDFVPDDKKFSLIREKVSSCCKHI